MTDTDLVEVDFWNLTAVKRYGKPEGWRWFSLSCAPGDCPPGWERVQGAAPIGVYQSGKKKGQTRWPPLRQCEPAWFMERAVMEEVKRQWEQETGLCSACRGAGKTIASSGPNGRTYRPCRDCAGTGKAKGKQHATGN